MTQPSPTLTRLAALFAGTATAALLPALAQAADAAAAPAPQPDYAQYEIDTRVSVMTDRRTHGISDSFREPAAELHVEAAHASGLVGVFELGTVAHEVYLNSDGYNALFAGGYRWGDPDGWHFGLGLARELFPGAQATLPNAVGLGLDPVTGQPGLVVDGVRNFNFKTSYAIFEFSWGPIEARYLNVLSRDFRGLNTPLVCGSLLVADPDPNVGLDCYARGDQDSRGSQLLDVDYQHPLWNGALTLLLHGGVQRVRDFSEAISWDWRVGVKRTQWSLDWKLEAVGAKAKQPEVYTATDDSGRLKSLASTGLIFTVSKSFE
jgi:hypothetical protein